VQRWLAGVIVVALAACGGGGASKAEQGRSIAEQAGLPKDVADFFALAATGTEATYRVSLDTTDAKGAKLQVTTTQRPPDVRVDTFHADGTIDATLSVNGHRYECTRAADQWQCGDLGPSSSSSDEAFGASTVQLAIDQFRQRAGDYDFRVEHRTIANVDATCLNTNRKPGHDQDPSLGASATLCLSAEGAILHAETSAGTLSASSYTKDIPGDAFALPAAISSSSPSS
jgi:hypothetical protein